MLGGGLVPGSLTLLAGPPGVGKSSLTLALLQQLAQSLRVLYAVGEESLMRVSERAARFGGKFHERLEVIRQTELDEILFHVEDAQAKVVVIDSVQTLACSSQRSGEDLDQGSAASISVAMRTIADHIQKDAQDVAVIAIGHVTQDGSISGPRSGLLHAVDCVLYFDGKPQETRRVLRADGKNRFGATAGPEAVAYFEMTPQGLIAVPEADTQPAAVNA